MDADLLFHQFAKPMEWLIPLRDSVPPLGEWRDDLVDESNVRDLIESAPWEILAAKIDRLTFRGRAYWDSTHAFPVSIAKRRTSRYFDASNLIASSVDQEPVPGGSRSFNRSTGGLTSMDAADRWRNPYRDEPENHSALRIARLSGMFLSSSS
ncbi:hypothetical protein PPTG_10465 [Phytophthora nicotianae INRA-310]|uniref:Uncharacterized protein n=1 Tax=Phytophthora nicotianae (strain INRA-310) TaxID=761204 RepID=W2QGH9_PHYN3|nr:hypothetical protein PPTG_10465 [Phytophthora nicotianae INRA-310]ETN11629.1 hypothetical protein PPTG_10465 [Phytophthora nicotianae INRA-310]